MIKVGLSGQDYVIGRTLDAFASLHVARKLGPAIPIVEGLVLPDNAGKDKTILTVLMLSHISDADTEYVIKKCLSVVTRMQGGSHAKVTAPDGSLMFDDMSMQDMLALTLAVIEDSLGDFFRTALAGLKTQDAEPSL